MRQIQNFRSYLISLYVEDVGDTACCIATTIKVDFIPSMSDRNHHGSDNDHRNVLQEENNDSDAFTDAVVLLYKICRGESPFVLDEVEQLLQTHPTAANQMIQCDPHDRVYRSPLHFACMSENAPIALIEAFLRVCPDSVRLSTPTKRRLPLHDACRYSTSLSIIQLIVKAWPDSVKQMHSDDLHNFFPLHEVLRNSTPSLDIIQFLVHQWPESIRLTVMGPQFPFNTLHWACLHGVSLSIIKFLVEQWPEAVRMRSGPFGLPLEIVLILSGTSTEKIEFLIAAWPDCMKEVKYQTLCTALRHQGKNTDTIALLLNLWPEEKRTGLLVHEACSGKTSFRVLQNLIEIWPDAVSIRDDDGNLPLHQACTWLARDEDSVPKVQFLVGKWPDAVQERTRNGMLPLHIACYAKGLDMCGYDDKLIVIDDAVATEVIRFLVRAWPESILIASEGEEVQGHPLPLDLVYQRDRYFQRGRHISTELIFILTNAAPPLHFACTNVTTAWIPTRMKTMKYLVDTFPDDLMRFHEGTLPFHCACRSGAPRSILEWLCQHSPEAARTCTTDTNDSPLHCYLSSTANTSETSVGAQQQQEMFLSAVEFLVEQYPASLRIPNRFGWLPFHVAAINDAPLDVLFYLGSQYPEHLLSKVQWEK